MDRITRPLRGLLGLDTPPVSHIERLVSVFGGFLGIWLTFMLARAYLGPTDALLFFAPIGASAVLLFAVPHGPLSQPWAVIGGHLIPAAIGVTCFRLFPDTIVAAACAVSLAIGAMHYLRCIHPPGGATALVAVIGGDSIHALGYRYLLEPVLLDVAILLLCAIGVNYFFAWRRYPAYLMPRRVPAVPPDEEINHSDLSYALAKLDSFIDVSEDDLARIYALANEHAHQSHLETSAIRRGRIYSNGRYDDQWALRQIVDESGNPQPEKDLVIYRVVAGKGRRSAGTCTRQEFARWARYEVTRNENSWQRCDVPVPVVS